MFRWRRRLVVFVDWDWAILASLRCCNRYTRSHLGIWVGLGSESE